MRMKVRVTEGVLQEDGKQAPSEECLEKGEVSLEKEEERVLRAASEMSCIDPTVLFVVSVSRRHSPTLFPSNKQTLFPHSIHSVTPLVSSHR